MYKISSINSLLTLVLFICSASASASDVNITQDMSYIAVDHNGKTVRIERLQDQSNQLTGGFAKTSRKCPPFCIQPMIVAPGVNTFGELEVIQFITDYVKTNKGLLIDARTPSWHAKGTIPGSVNILGIEKKPNPFWDFSAAKNLLLWCNGMWCGQSPRAIQGLLKLGYPAEKLHYYRDGMQGWKILGLTVSVPQ